MKAQIFIVTIIFLVGLIYLTQQILFQYAFIDEPALTMQNDYYIIDNIKSQVIKAIKYSESCDTGSNSAFENLERMKNTLLLNTPPGGYVPDIDYLYNCNNWWNTKERGNPAPFTVVLHILSGGIETTESFSVYRFDDALKLDFQDSDTRQGDYEPFYKSTSGDSQTYDNIEVQWTQTGAIDGITPAGSNDIYRDGFLLASIFLSSEISILKINKIRGKLSEGKPFIRLYSFDDSISGMADSYYCGTVYLEDEVVLDSFTFMDTERIFEYFQILKDDSLDIKFFIPQKTDEYSNCVGFPINGLDLYY